jgi:hypothetical protein
VNIFFDNCTSPTLAATLDGFVQYLAHRAFHIKDMPCGRHALDLEWIQMLAERDDGPWIIITGDGRILKNKPERTALRQSGLSGFVLAPAYQKTPLNQVASLLIWRWPEMEQLLGLVAGPALYELPINRSSKPKPLPL